MTAPTAKELETQLESAEGNERLDLLLRLAQLRGHEDPARAALHADEAVTLARALGDRIREARALDLYGMTHLNRGRCEEALQALLAALQIFEEEGDRAGEGATLGNVGLAHYVWQNDDKALTCHEKALRIMQEVGDRTHEAHAYNGIGLVLARQGKYDAALENFQRGLAIGTEVGYEPAMVGALNNIGVIHRIRGELGRAATAFRDSIPLKKALGDRKGLAGALINLGSVHLERAEFEEARPLLEEGLRTAEEAQAKEFVITGLHSIVDLHRLSGDFEAALTACRRLIEVKDDMFKEENARRIAEMQARFDTEQAERAAETSRLRNRELSDQLRHAERLGAVGRLAGGIAHDFNNLLTAIGGCAELMLYDFGRNHPHRRHATEIRDAVDRARALTGQLLAFSRNQILQPRVLNLSAVVADLSGMLDRLLGEDILLQTDLKPDLGSVSADASQLEQVIVNLAVNARDAMPTGGTLTIQTRDVEAGAVPAELFENAAASACVRLVVSDTGCGMDPQVIGHIFEPFFSTKSRDKGIGLGLATVHGVVHQSGGGITVRSAPGQGSRFEIYLPRCQGEAEITERGSAARPRTPGSETIFLVEDDEAVRGLAAEILGLQGYNVFPFRAAEEALGRLETHTAPVHLLLTDVILSGMRGTDLADRFRAARPETRVLYMSGYPYEALAVDGTLRPGTELIEKPFSAAMLARRVRAVLDSR